jgi:CheY-like chemotaxis protein
MQTVQQKTSLKILLAEDDADDRFFFAKALNELSIDTHLTMVHDGEALMEYLIKHLNNLPDALFLDLSMPRKSGFECLTEIKDELQLIGLPVIMFSTAYPRDFKYEQSIIGMLLNNGAYDFIRKPNDFAGLKTVIYDALCKLTAQEIPLSIKPILTELITKNP